MPDRDADAATIRTARLVLRRFRPDDTPTLARYRSDPDVARFQGWDAPVTAEAAAELVERFADGDPARPGWFQYALTCQGQLIGDLGVRLDDELRSAEVGHRPPSGPGRRRHGSGGPGVGRAIGLQQEVQPGVTGNDRTSSPPAARPTVEDVNRSREIRELLASRHPVTGPAPTAHEER